VAFLFKVGVVGVSPWCRFPLIWNEAGKNTSEALQRENQFQSACPAFVKLVLRRWTIQFLRILEEANCASTFFGIKSLKRLSCRSQTFK
jgi:hypothetical protein